MPKSASERHARFVTNISTSALSGTDDGSGLSLPVVVLHGAELQFWTNPDGGSFTCGKPSKGTNSVQSVRVVLPGTIPDQSYPSARRGRRPL